MYSKLAFAMTYFHKWLEWYHLIINSNKTEYSSEPTHEKNMLNIAEIYKNLGEFIYLNQKSYFKSIKKD